MSPKERIYLVKSSNQILGPYSKQELIQELQSRHISIIDELRTTKNRWGFIREHSEFLELVKKLRFEQDQVNEDTMTSTLTSHTITHTDIIPTNQNKLPVITGGETHQREALKSFGVQTQPTLAKKSNDHLKTVLLSFFIGACVFVGAYYVLSQQKQKNTLNTAEQYIQETVVYRKSGLYAESLGFYKKAVSIGQPKDEIIFDMAPLLIIDGDSVQVRRVLEKEVLSSQRSRQEVVQGYTSIGLSYLVEGDFKSADQAFEKALLFDSRYTPARINLGTSQFFQEKYNEAKNTFESIHEEDKTYNMAKLALVMSDIEASRSLQVNSYDHYISDLNQFIQNNIYLKNEALLLKIYLYTKNNQNKEAMQSIDDLFKMNPRLSMDHSPNPMIYSQMVGWSKLSEYCDEITNNLEVNAKLMAFKAYCLFQNNKISEAEQILKDAVTQSPKDTSILQFQAFVYQQISQLGMAQAILQSNQVDKPYPIHLILEAEICRSKNDLACEERAWNRLLVIDSQSIEALTGLTRISHLSKKSQQANNFLKKGLAISSFYTPLLKIKFEMENP